MVLSFLFHWKNAAQKRSLVEVDNDQTEKRLKVQILTPVEIVRQEFKLILKGFLSRTQLLYRYFFVVFKRGGFGDSRSSLFFRGRNGGGDRVVKEGKFVVHLVVQSV